jgi:hypothetical protein
VEVFLASSVMAALRDAGLDPASLADLLDVHRRLWSLEDLARSIQAAAEDLARVKHAIDKSNAERHGLIDVFDAAVPLDHPASGHGVAYAETPGELCDRLLILALKAEAAGRLAADPDLPIAVRAECQGRLKRMLRWKGHVEACLVAQLRDVAAGRAILPPRAEFKMYNDVLLNPVTRAELDDAEGRTWSPQKISRPV